jgi:hypothetical protein
LLAGQQLLPPSALFVFVLGGMVPAATLGALLVHHNSSWTWQDLATRACTGMGSALAVLSLVRLIWQISLHDGFPALQLIVMLLVTSVGATFGSHPLVSEYILNGAIWALTNMRGFVTACAMIVGALLGYLLTTVTALSCFTPFGVIIGIGVALALLLRVEQVIKQKYS